MQNRGNRIARIEAFRLKSKAIKEAWTEDEYGWPSNIPSLLIKGTSLLIPWESSIPLSEV